MICKNCPQVMHNANSKQSFQYSQKKSIKKGLKVFTFSPCMLYNFPQPKNTCPLLSMARIVLHSEHRNLPDFVALSFLEQMGHTKIFGNTSDLTTIPLVLKKSTESANESLILKNWENPSN